MQVIRSLDDAVELVLEGNSIFWRKEGKRIRNQKQCFEECNPGLKEVIDQLDNFPRDTITQKELSAVSGLDCRQIRHYVNNIMPGLRPEKKAPLPVGSAYAVIADFMPVIEGWKTAGVLADELGVSRSSVANYCRAGLIEAKYLLKRYHVSPIGVLQLKDCMNLMYSSRADKEGWIYSEDAAEQLGVSKSTVNNYCRKKLIYARKHSKRWMIPPNQLNSLRALIMINEPVFEFGGKRYYFLAYAGREAAERRGRPEEARAITKRIYHLVSAYPEDIKPVRKNKRAYLDEETKDMVCDLMRISKAGRELGINKHIVSGLMKKGVLGLARIGPTNWTTYSSVMEYKRAHS